jgi:hypothetical protein
VRHSFSPVEKVHKFNVINETVAIHVTVVHQLLGEFGLGWQTKLLTHFAQIVQRYLSLAVLSNISLNLFIIYHPQYQFNAR